MRGTDCSGFDGRLIIIDSVAVEDDSGVVVLSLLTSLGRAELISERGELVGSCEVEEHERTGHVLTHQNGKCLHYFRVLT